MSAPLPIGVMFPGDALGGLGRAELNRWVDAVVECGFGHVSFGDHVLGVNSESLSVDEYREWSSRWSGPAGSTPYTHEIVFAEPFTTMAYIAGRSELAFTTNVLVLPQRQVALVAKQAAEVDLLSIGGLRLGVGAGWSTVEYEALGVQFDQRAAIFDEQVEVMRELWTQTTVSFDGAHHRLRGVGIQKLPARHIPLWFGGEAPRALRRIGRVGDGWFPPVHVRPGSRATECQDRIAEAAIAHGRNPADIGIEPRLYAARMSPQETLDLVEGWTVHGATHFCVDTRFGPRTLRLDEHCDQMRETALLLQQNGVMAAG